VFAVFGVAALAEFIAVIRLKIKRGYILKNDSCFAAQNPSRVFNTDFLLGHPFGCPKIDILLIISMENFYPEKVSKSGIVPIKYILFQ
jgi:hypothetical protein